MGPYHTSGQGTVKERPFSAQWPGIWGVGAWSGAAQTGLPPPPPEPMGCPTPAGELRLLQAAHAGDAGPGAQHLRQVLRSSPTVSPSVPLGEKGDLDPPKRKDRTAAPPPLAVGDADWGAARWLPKIAGSPGCPSPASSVTEALCGSPSYTPAGAGVNLVLPSQRTDPSLQSPGGSAGL